VPQAARHQYSTPAGAALHLLTYIFEHVLRHDRQPQSQSQSQADYTTIHTTLEASHLSSPANPATKSSPFLSLPAVLLRAGLVSDAEIDLNGGREIHYHWGPQRPFQVSHDLLLTCRTFYTNIHPIIYSTNVFYIRYRDKKKTGTTPDPESRYHPRPSVQHSVEP
jgi:hypothetical protein